VSELVGVRGTVTVAIPGPGRPGEIVVRSGGGTEAYLAYADGPISRGAVVLIYEHRGGRMVDVMESTEAA
jgi:hypothetical protein